MGNYSTINFDELIQEYGIKVEELTPAELERVKIAFAIAKDTDEFLKEIKKMINGK